MYGSTPEVQKRDSKKIRPLLKQKKTFSQFEFFNCSTRDCENSIRFESFREPVLMEFSVFV